MPWGKEGDVMTKWLRFAHRDRVGFGILDGDTINVHEGDMFATAAATGETLARADVEALIPCVPSKMVCLWNNFHQLAAKLGTPEPAEPLYFFKSTTAFLPHGGIIKRPRSYDGKVIYEGELGIVIGKECRHIREAEAADHIFGYTCVNDVTAADLLKKDNTFDQWTRAKSFDTFGVFGPVIETEADPTSAVLCTVLNGAERQNYPLADMIFGPARLVSLLSRDVTLLPGDVIACGTSLGVGSMKEPENTVEITIDGIGTLSNQYMN
jgi:2-keto-4-pentenoate hydratase/2-oxohepta-3-ene-1,7-dioic acid hydratase in catechol pathway